MTTNNFINECVKCINMCKKEFSSEFAEWIEKLIFTEITGDSDSKEFIDKCNKCSGGFDVEKLIAELRDNADFQNVIKEVIYNSLFVGKKPNDNTEKGISVDEKGNMTIKANNITIEGATI